jgi:hypothetical protein
LSGNGATSLGGRLAHIRKVLDGVLAGAPETMLELKRRLARELTIDPKPQVLQALSALRQISDPKGRAIGSRAAILHLAVEASVFELWDSADTTPEILDRVALIPPLIALAASAEQAFDDAIDRVDPEERATIGRMHGALRLPEEPLLAAVVVVPELRRLSMAARSGTLSEAAPSLTSDERDAIASTGVQDGSDAMRANRVFVDAIALRTLMERDLAQFQALPPRVAGDEAAAKTRRDLSRRLESLRVAHGVVSDRLDAWRSEHFARARSSDGRLDRARRSLFAAYVNLSKALAGHLAEEFEGGVRERILEAEQAAAAIDALQLTTRGLMQVAAAGVEQSAETTTVLPPDMQDLVRERRRRNVLAGIAAALVPVALTANIAFYRERGRGPATTPDFLSASMPVRQIMPIGRALYSQVSTFLWEDLSEFERRDRVTELGRLAAQRSYQVLIVVDEARRERARWSLTRGAEIVTDRTSDAPQHLR